MTRFALNCSIEIDCVLLGSVASLAPHHRQTAFVFRLYRAEMICAFVQCTAKAYLVNCDTYIVHHVQAPSCVVAAIAYLAQFSPPGQCERSSLCLTSIDDIQPPLIRV